MGKRRKHNMHPAAPVAVIIGVIALFGVLCSYGPLFGVADAILTPAIEAIHGR